MPSADDDFVPDFDNFDEQPQAVPAAPPAADPQDDPWGFNDPQHEQPPPPPPKRESKKKKKGKKDGAARKVKAEDGEDSSAYPRSITPSPPTDHGAKLQDVLPPAAQVPAPAQPVVPSSPLVNFDDETTAVEDIEPLPPTTPQPTKLSSTPSPAVSPVVRSPRPAPAKPAVTASPNRRPSSLYLAPPRDRNNSLTGYRPPVSLAAPAQQRRESFAASRPRFGDPPLPHMPQPHFFGLPDLGLNFGQKKETGSPAGSNGYCCRIDSLADSGDEDSAKKAREALLVGCEGGLDVYVILNNKLELVGRLEGLRGSIIGAKILPHLERYDQLQSLRPLVAVIVHGPMVDDRRDSGPEGEEVSPNENEPPTHFQTTVEIYSLQTQIYVATIYRSAPVAIEQPVVGQISSLPDPVGDLHIDAKGQFITVSSGKSGEIFVFTQSAAHSLEGTRFRCVGKYWTVVQKPLSAPPSRPASASDVGTPTETRDDVQIPVYSLSQRWLAVVPPSTSSSISIQGVPLTSDVNRNPPGCSTHAASSQPIVSCEVVGTDVEGAWSRLGRQAAQGLMKYSQKGLEMGLQGWKELTQPSPPGGRPNHDRSSSKEDLFPPTNAPSSDPGRLAKEPAVVSIIDLECLLQWEAHQSKHPPPVMATFALVDGCNFLSFSSTGTRLLTTSRKGEVSTIWDLQQAAHGVPKRSTTDGQDMSTSPCVKQLQRLTRNSPSTVLGCAWTRDDDAVAILTAHGTVHLHEVPSRAPSRRRKRSSISAAPSAEKADATVSLSTGLSPPSANQGFLGSIKSSWQTVSTQVNSIRTNPPASTFGLPTTFAGFKEATAAAGNAGSRAVARGISQGYTAAKGGASDYWHADDNKIRHTKALQEPFTAKSLKWIRRNNTISVAIACGGTIHVHPVQRVIRRKGHEVVSGLKHERYARKAFPLTPIATRNEAGGLQGLLTDTCTGQGPHGFWSLRHPSPPPDHLRERRSPPKMLYNQASDVETNPPYCPFHVDTRVSIFAFDEYQGRSLLEAFEIKGHGIEDETCWTFGEALPPQFKVNERVVSEIPDDEDFLGSPAEHDLGEEDEDKEDVADQMESRLTIQPARRNRGGTEEIRVHTRPARRRDHGNEGGAFDMLEEDEGMM
ncbi:hypothetical protein DOTSEDRAFT_67737 [Lecanosticta acicola]|uniref:Uncharacterized protein n=1 Tax=Lecanosticta acicola TaxID=111012 RepID=A0AAI8Z1C0_9PEZI|nr:hypothetical protein DOTSEDRAFT_67737 [Lecanosticta acicola]